MVQDTDRSIRTGFLSRLGRFLQRKKVLYAPLDFEVDVDKNGNHVIEVFMNIEDNQVKVENVKELWQHGFSIQQENLNYFISNDDFETLLSIRSLNPKISKEGKIVSEVHPPVLNYLRERNRISETQDSKELRIYKKPPKKRAEIQYDSEKGLDIKTGYELVGHEEIVPKSALKTVSNGEYIQDGRNYYPYPIEEDPKIQELIDAENLHVNIDQIPEFFKRDLVLIKSQFKAILSDEAEKVRIIDDDFLLVFHLDTGGKGWLDFVVEYEVGEYVLPHRIFAKKEEKYQQINDTTWVQVDRQKIEEVEEQLEKLGAIPTETGFRLDITKFSSLEEFVNKIGGTKVVSEEYQRFLDEITDFNYNENFELPTHIEKDVLSSNIKLRPYQRAGIHWLDWLTSHYLHGVLADDMGLGKTIQTILCMRLAYENSKEKSHSLVLAPRSVVRFWNNEIKRVYPKARVNEYHGIYRNPHIFERKHPHIFLTTYETTLRDIDYLKNVPFLFVILDEGTRIKNPATKTSKAIKELNAVHRFVLSGTPIENRPAELWSIFDFLMRGHLGTYSGFISKFEKPIIDGDKNVAKQLAKRIRPFILRRLKEKVEDLPEKIPMTEWCELTKEQRSIYGQIQDTHVALIRRKLLKGQYVSYATSILPILTKLKQVCDHPALVTGKKEPLMGRSNKFDLVIERMNEIFNNNECVVLFSHFLGTLDLFEQYFLEKDIDFIRIDGSTQDRQQLIDMFNKEEVPAAICSIRAAGHGITLISANHVVHVDRWWNPAIEDQATDRVHRIGQTKTVYVYKILTEGTLEEKIDKLIEKKRGISDQVIGAATKGKLKWTKKEILKILEPIPI